jgi:hypothetical protein
MDSHEVVPLDPIDGAGVGVASRIEVLLLSGELAAMKLRGRR